MHVLDILSEHLDVHKVILQKNLLEIRTTCVETPARLSDIGKLGRTALHLATICCRNITEPSAFPDILNTTIGYMRHYGLDMNERDTITGWDWTQYANFNILDSGLCGYYTNTVEEYLEREKWQVIECRRPSMVFPIENFDAILKSAIWQLSINIICNLLLLHHYEDRDFIICIGCAWNQH
ncbi:hypothetical protein Trydic_g9311 [Trypoxylus dichotomus]